MLKLIHHIKELDYHSIMELYDSDNEISDDFSSCESQSRFAVEEAFYHYLREVFFSVSNAFLAVWLNGGRYISALRVEPYRDGLLLEGLETAPAYRNQGYATKLLTSVLPVIENMSYSKLYAHVSKRNIPSLRVHEKCDFHKISDSAVLIDGSVTNLYYTLVRDLPEKTGQ